MSTSGEILTSEQRAALEAELAELEGPRRAAAVEAIATARSFGDLSENFEYHAAKNEQGLLEARILKLRDRIQTAVVVEHDTDEHIGPGSIVEIADEDGEVIEVTIASRDGVSSDSPLGRASSARASGTWSRCPRRAGRGGRPCARSAARAAGARGTGRGARPRRARAPRRRRTRT